MSQWYRRRRLRPLRSQEPPQPFRALVALGDDDLPGHSVEYAEALLATDGVAKVDVMVRPHHLRFDELRALTDEPSVLLLDEPTSSLDPRATAFVEDLIKFALRAGRIVILVTHDGAQADRLGHARLALVPQMVEEAA